MGLRDMTTHVLFHPTRKSLEDLQRLLIHLNLPQHQRRRRVVNFGSWMISFGAKGNPAPIWRSENTEKKLVVFFSE